MCKSIFFVLLVFLFNLHGWSAHSNERADIDEVRRFLPGSLKEKCGDFKEYKGHLSAVNCESILLSYYCLNGQQFGTARDIICENKDRKFWLNNGLKNGHGVLSDMNPFERQKELERLDQGMQDYSKANQSYWRRKPVSPREDR